MSDSASTIKHTFNGYKEHFDALSRMVGNTPMIEILYNYRGQTNSIFAKCEYYNLTGSTKDRIAIHILHKAFKGGALKSGDTIVEASSGNTGIAFASIGTLMGHNVKIIMPDWLSRERSDLMSIFGSKTIMVSKAAGGFLGSIALAEEIGATETNIFLPRQFSNEDNCEAHAFTTGPEIWRDLVASGRIPDAFVAGVGTGGTVMGVGRYLKHHNPAIKIHPVEPAESPTLSKGHKIGSHRIQGISDEFIPSILKLGELDNIISVNDGDAIIAARKLASQLGLGVGISSGCNVIAAIYAQQQLGLTANVVTILPDSNKKYLTTDLIRDESVKENYLAPRITFVGYRTVPKANGIIL